MDDATDAADVPSQGQSQVDWMFSLRKIEQPKHPSAPHPEAEVYKKYEKRGVALIFNHKTFSIRECSERKGTDMDRNDLMEVLNHLKFDVRVYNDLTYAEIVEVLLVVSKMDHSAHDCLLVSAMSHGDEGILYAKDRSYPTKKLWTYFSAIHCPSLAGKPKLFFIQACRGSQTDPGITLGYTESDSNSDEIRYTIPVTADILIMYSTVEGYYAWRDPERGSYFIQSLVRQLKKHYQNRDLLSILTCVNREVAIDFTSEEPRMPAFNQKKEMCSIVSMLTRLFYLD